MFSSFNYMPRSDRRSLLAIAMVAVVAAVAYGALSLDGESDGKSDGGQGQKATTDGHYANAAERTTDTYTTTAATAVEAAAFEFDPNTADSATLTRLGLSRWQARNIINYRRHGGVYQRKEDFARVYGLTAGQYRRLAPYIRIADEFKPAAELPEVRRSYDLRRAHHDNGGKTYDNGNNGNANNDNASNAARYQHKLHRGEFVAVNSADTTTLMRIPGIGSYYARQIVKLRDRLGGLATAAQLQEIEDFPTEAIPYISINPEQIHRLDINTLSLQQLKRHPYINYYQARAIVTYRRLKGSIKSIDELRQMPDFSTADLLRLEPYIKF